MLYVVTVNGSREQKVYFFLVFYLNEKWVNQKIVVKPKK